MKKVWFYRWIWLALMGAALGGRPGSAPAASLPWEPPGPCSRRTGLVISEIMYHPAPRADGKQLEYVELFNSREIPEDLGGYRLAGEIDFTFPPNTVLPSGGYLVVAAAPQDLQAAYGLTGVLGPYQKRLAAPGTLRLQNKADAVLLEVSYSNLPPWPTAADGAGPSLVLARPSYGEGNPLAWEASLQVGGAPGAAEADRPDPLRAVVINEFLAHTDPPLADFIELYNHSNQEVDLSGCSLSDDPATNKFLLPPGTKIPARGFLSYEAPQLGFGLKSSGETLYLRNTDGTRVLDAVRYEGQENGVSMGRYPDGADEFYRLKTRTPGAPNSDILVHDLAINEIMYHPISGDDDDQYVELCNHGAAAVDLSRWRFTAGITFEFPPGVTLAPGGYLVVARDAQRLRANYPNLNPDNTFGNFQGKLAHGGERLALAMPHPDTVTNLNGSLTTNYLYITVDEVTYGTGGRWGKWAAGGGSSLELIDPRSNHRLAANWADSDETAKSAWTVVSNTGVLDNGNSSYPMQLQLFLEGEGECLVDDVEVVGRYGTNLVANSTFETGVSGWAFQGTQDLSSWETTEGYGGGNSLHVRSVGRGDPGANRVRTALLGVNTLSPGTTATLRAKVRWLKGFPEILFRLRGNWLEAVGEMALPKNLGTPGARNSRAVANAGPAIYQVQHRPVLPVSGQAVVVTARVHAPDGLADLVLNYRVDPSANVTSIPMRDDGTGGDALAGDGVYAATIPGLSGGLVAFYVQARANGTSSASTRFPSDAPAHECLVRFGEAQPAGNLPTYRLWLTQATVTKWTNRLKLHNGLLDGTFVYGNRRAVYNIGACYAGSPFIRPGYSGPAGGLCGYSLAFPDDDRFLGANDFALDWPVRDSAEQAEQVACWMVGELGIPFNYRRFINLFVNGARRGAVYEDAQRPNDDFVHQWSPTDTQGELHKIDDWFEFADDGATFVNTDASLQNFTTTGGTKKLARYRWNWRKRAIKTSANDYRSLFGLVDGLNTASTTAYTANTERLVDVDEWTRTFAMEHIVGNWDSYGYRRGKNMYTYKPQDGKWLMLTWDIDFVLGAGSDTPTTDLFSTIDPTMARMYSHPPFRRASFRALYDALNGPMLTNKVNPLIDAYYLALRNNGIAAGSPTSIKTFLQGRRTYLQQQLNAVAASFAITSNGGQPITTAANLLPLTGTAPVALKTLEVNGVAYPVTWTTVTAWTMSIPLLAGTNLLTVRGYDSWGNPFSNAAPAIVVNCTAAPELPQDRLAINEIMYHPALPKAEFIELFNASSRMTFDLSGWRLAGVGLTFPDGSLIAPQQYLVIARDRAAFAAAYGTNISVAGVFPGTLSPGGERLRLVQPAVAPAGDLVVDEVKYGDKLPWPEAADGGGPSLQLIDASQDHHRVGNWAASATNASVRYTPGAPNSVRASLEPFPPLWLNEVQPDNLSGPVDQMGHRAPWLELYNAGTNRLDLADYYLANNYTNLAQWAFPTEATIGPGEFIVIWVDGHPEESGPNEWHTDFALASTNGSIALVRAQGAGFAVVDYLNYKWLAPGRSYGRFPDGAPFDHRVFDYPTPGSTNNVAWAPVRVLLNEWMAGNTRTVVDPADGGHDDWFELYNPSANRVDLTDFALSNSLTNLAKFIIPPGTTIAPHGLLLVWADNQDALNAPAQTGLHVNFKLSRQGDTLALFMPDGSLLDAVTFGPQTDDISQGRFPDGAETPFYLMDRPTPGAANIVTNVNLPPVLAPIGDHVVLEGQTLRLTAQATDPNAPPRPLHFSLDAGAAAGMSIEPVTGQFAWTPAATQIPSTNYVTIRVTRDDPPYLSGAETIRVVAAQRNDSPVLETIEDQRIDEGKLLTFTVSASDPNPGQFLTFSLGPGAPAGASLNPTNGVFRWMPTEAQGPGTYVVTACVTDDGFPNLSATNAFKVVVNEVNTAPVLSPIPNPSIYLGDSLTLRLKANDADLPPNRLSYSLIGAAPAGLQLDPDSGVLTWTPASNQVASAYSVTAEVTDDGSPPLSDRQTFTIFVFPPRPWRFVSATGTASSSVLYIYLSTPGDLYVDDVQLVAGSPPGVGANTLINGDFETPLAEAWTVSPNHADSEITSAVRHAGTNSLHLIATTGGTTRDSSIYQTIDPPLTSGAPYTLSFWYLPGHTNTALTIRLSGSGVRSDTPVGPATNNPPMLAFIPDQAVRVGDTLAFAVQAADPDQPDQSLTFSLGPNAPAGATINWATGLFSWTPTAAQILGRQVVTVLVTDNGSPPASASQSFAVTVQSPVAAPRILSLEISTQRLVNLTWTAEPGASYQVQSKGDLGEPQWTNVGDAILATAPTASTTDPRGGEPHRYYRIVLTPP